MDPIEAFLTIMQYVDATADVARSLTPKRGTPMYRALLRATDEMVAHSADRHPHDQIALMFPQRVARLREIMADLGM